MIIEFLGAAREVTGSCHYVSFQNKQGRDIHLLVDCGMEQGADLYVNQEIPVNASLVDYVFVTHAHIDHSGLLPLLYNHGFRGAIYATEATTALCDIMLKDSAHIQESEAEWQNRKAKRAGNEETEPMYTLEDAVGVMEQFHPLTYDEKVRICDGLEVRFVDAGHLLGSASIEMWITEPNDLYAGLNRLEQESEYENRRKERRSGSKQEETDPVCENEDLFFTRKLVFSGDVGNGNRPLIRDPQYIRDADYVIMESTYGNRNHETPPDYAVLLAEVIRETFQRGGNLVIPAFAVGRTQEMLYHLRRIKTEEMLPEYPDFEVYMDSPLAVEATTVFNKSVLECFKPEAIQMIKEGTNPITFDGLKIAVTSGESQMINFIEKPKVIISASGMCEAGRIRHHLKHNLWRADSTILFVGFQCEGTLGHSLLNGVKKVKLFGEEIDVKARIVNLPGISGHADMEHLTRWIAAFDPKPRRVFIVHGEEQTAVSFAEHLQKDLGLYASAPYTGDVYDLISGECIQNGARKHAVKKARRTAANSVFERLVAAGQRLAAVIQKCHGMANKDLAKFADQINALCDKWER